MTQWIAACAAGDIDPEDVVPFDHGGHAYAIYRSPADLYYATDGHCTHERTLLCDGLVLGAAIECPLHNGRFDYTSGKPRATAGQPRCARTPGHRRHSTSRRWTPSA
jgi:3-phenylpropionate/trans-cinnamate dioxygenase ferredoxin subunit